MFTSYARQTSVKQVTHIATRLHYERVVHVVVERILTQRDENTA
jgi:hypothetical protein